MSEAAVREAVQAIEKKLGEHREIADANRKSLEDVSGKFGLFEEQHKKAMAEMADLVNTVVELKRANTLQREIAIAGSGLSPEEKAQVSVFVGFMRKGDDFLRSNLNDMERKALSTLNNPEGGYMLRPAAVGRIVERVKQMSPVRKYAKADSIAGQEMTGVIDNDDAAIEWAGETEAPNTTKTPRLGEWRIRVHEMRAKPKATQTMLDDSEMDPEAWLMRRLADLISRAEASEFVNGNGATRPRGFLNRTLSTSKDATRTWGEIQKVKSGANGAFVAAPNSGDCLIRALGELHPKYWPGAVWAMNRYTCAEIMTLKDGDGKYLWQPSFAEGRMGTIAGVAVDPSFDHIPSFDSATGAKGIVLANFGEAYQILDRQGMTVLRDPYSAKPYVEFYTRYRVGGDVVNSEAIKVVTFEA